MFRFFAGALVGAVVLYAILFQARMDDTQEVCRQALQGRAYAVKVSMPRLAGRCVVYDPSGQLLPVTPVVTDVQGN